MVRPKPAHPIADIVYGLFIIEAHSENLFPPLLFALLCMPRLRSRISCFAFAPLGSASSWILAMGKGAEERGPVKQGRLPKL